MILERITVPGLAHHSYLLGDEYQGVCAVIDARRDIDIYLHLAEQHSMRITHILETHIHADFVSGSRELAAQTGAPIGVGAKASVDFGVIHLADGDRIEIGNLELEVLHTPGHTPEHICFLARGGAGAPAPWGLFSGDTLFAGEVGRPDLLGEGTEEALASQLFHTLRSVLLPLGDEIVVYPAHGAGSPCGASIGERAVTTIGYERKNNPLLKIDSQDEFAATVLAGQSPAPAYYRRMKTINAQGPRIFGQPPVLQPLSAQQLLRLTEERDSMLLDTRSMAAYGGAHIPGSIQIGLRAAFPIWAGEILDEAFPIWAGRMLIPEDRLYLVLEDPQMLDTVQRQLFRIGYENLGGYLRQGMRSWLEAGLPFDSLPQLSVHALRQNIQENQPVQVLDVRSQSEWQQGHIPTAQHIYVAELKDEINRLDRDIPVVTYCGSGYRASIAASILKSAGFSVQNVPGSMSAWLAAGYEVETPE